MTAVIEKQPSKARARKVAPPAPAQAPAISVSEDSALFAEVGDFLAQASGTDEDHAFSGESDRLLSIGAMIALDAAKGKFSNTNAENTVYDIAACINSARLVPDDDESVERTLHINNAAERLAIIAGMPVHHMIFTDVQRPSREVPAATGLRSAASKQFTEERLKDLYWQAHLHVECAHAVLLHYAEHADSSAIFALRDLLDVYFEHSKARVDGNDIGTLISGDIPDLACDLERIESLLAQLAIDQDDAVLHGVNHLLRSATRILGGDVGILE